MHNSDNKFFNFYKQLDKLCSDMYDCRGGISAYITDMDANKADGERLVPCWQGVYKDLKHVRHIRNQIAHEADNCRFSEKSDLEFARRFYKSLVSGKDPLALLRKARKSKRKTENARRAAGFSGGVSVMPVIVAGIIIAAIIFALVKAFSAAV